MKFKAVVLCFFLGLIFISSKSPKLNSIFIDSGLPSLQVNNSVNSKSFHIFSHGKPGELFIDNQWLDAGQIAVYFSKELKNKKELYIYGCNFGEGEIGRNAVNYLQKTLNIDVNASTNITGKNGDWILEIGKGKNGLTLPQYKGDLQLDTVHYLNPMIAGSYNSDTSIQEEFIYISTPSTTTITIQMNYASGIGSPRISITDLTAGTTSINTSGTFTVNNSNPVRIQFVDANNIILLPGTTPTTIALIKGGKVVSGNTAGLKFTSSDKFYVNYRANSQAQAGSELTKGVSALGQEFRWGGSPIEAATTTADLGNMLSVMATEDNTTIVINNIKSGTKFVNENNGTTLLGPSITRTLNKGDSFILYAPVEKSNVNSAQNKGWLGAKVIADKNVTVVVGGLMQQGEGGNNRDIGFDQLVPVQLLGLEHVIMQGNGGNSEKVIVVSTVDNTKVYVNGNANAVATLANAGDYVLIPASTVGNFNSDKNMFVRVSSPSYVFNKIYGSNVGNTSSLMFIPPLSCFGQKTVDLIPDARNIGTTTYTGTELVVLAADGVANVPVVKESGVTLTPFLSGGIVTGKSNWKSYRYTLTAAKSNVKISSAGTIQAELFGANGAAGFGGYFSGFGDASTYDVAITSPIGFLCPKTGTISVPSGLGTYQWYRNDLAISNATNYFYNLDNTDDIAGSVYYVIITFSGGCTVRSNQVTSDICPCTKPGTTGTPDGFTKLGISIRDKRTTTNWPKDIGNGFLTMEANKKGFVITRIANPDTAISDPVLGMLIYNTTKNCLQLYDGSSWKCIQPTCN